MNKQKILAELSNHLYLVDQNWLQNILSILKNTSDAEFESALFTDKDEQEKNIEIVGDVGILNVNGPIFPEPNIVTEWLGIGCALSTFSHDLVSLEKNNAVNGIAIKFNTPGGSVTGVDETSALIKKVSESKPIHGYVGGCCASAGYWLASACSDLQIGKTGICGSIGVVTSVFAPKEDDFYVEITSTQSPNKRVDPRTKEGEELYRQNLDAICDVFVSTVAENRGVSTGTVLSDFGKGWVLVGQQAVDVKMVDSIGSFNVGAAAISYTETTLEHHTTITNEEDEKMDLKTLKKDHAELVAALLAEHQATADAAIQEKDSEIATLQQKISDNEASTKETETRLLALEKANEISALKQMEATAESIFVGKLSASNIPERLYAKVQKHVNYNAFVEDGAFNAATFGEAVDAEIKDWETTLSTEKIQGLSITRPEETDSNATIDAAADRMAKFLN